MVDPSLIDENLQPALINAFSYLSPFFGYSGKLKIEYRKNPGFNLWDISVLGRKNLRNRECLVMDWDMFDIGELAGKILHYEVNPKLEECSRKILTGIPQLDLNGNLSEEEAQGLIEKIAQRLELPIAKQYYRLAGLVYRISGLVFLNYKLDSKRRERKDIEEESMIMEMAERIYRGHRESSIRKLAGVSPYEARTKILELFGEDIYPEDSHYD